MSEQVDPAARPLGEMAGHSINPHMRVALEGIGASQHEHSAKKQPLQLQPGIRAHVERLAHNGIGGAHHHRRQHQPSHVKADETRDGIDDAAEREQQLHGHPPLAAVDRRCGSGREITGFRQRGKICDGPAGGRPPIGDRTHGAARRLPPAARGGLCHTDGIHFDPRAAGQM